MITLGELDVKVREEFGNEPCMIKGWERMRNQLACNDPVWGGYAETGTDELADFCWMCGCSMSYTQDYWDGSPTFCITLPTTEEEYQTNLKEANAWWKEVCGEE